jgi:hypothetical protein
LRWSEEIPVEPDKGTKIVRPLVDSVEVFLKKYVEETIEYKRSHIKYVPALPSLERDQKPGAPRRAQLDPGTVHSPFKYWGLFYCSHLEKSLEQASLMSQISRQDLSKRQMSTR